PTGRTALSPYTTLFRSIYPQYWLLNYKLWNPPGNVMPRDEAAQFLREHDGTYLAERLRGSWIQAAVRRGDFETARELGDVADARSQVQCAILEARHLTGQRATARQALDAFTPGRDCWNLADQLVADGVLGWKELQPLLRAAVETDRTADARRFADLLFEP